MPWPCPRNRPSAWASRASAISARVLAEQQEAEPGSTHLFAMDPEFAGRPDGLGSMSELARPALHPQRHPPDGRRAGLHRAEEAARCSSASSTPLDGRLKDFKLRVLKDDKQYFPSTTPPRWCVREVVATPSGVRHAVRSDHRAARRRHHAGAQRTGRYRSSRRLEGRRRLPPRTPTCSTTARPARGVASNGLLQRAFPIDWSQGRQLTSSTCMVPP